MIQLLALLPILVCLATALMRVSVIRGVQIEGKHETTVALSFSERLRYHRMSMYALGALLFINAVGGTIPTAFELLAIVAMWGILSVPIRYRLTSQGIALNRVVFRRWTEFRGYHTDKNLIRLL